MPPEAVPVLADELNLSRADVHGVVTFYRDFRPNRPGRATVRVCRAEACQAVGAGRLVAHAAGPVRRVAGRDHPGRFGDPRQVFCLGNCALGPSVQVNGRLHGRVGPAGWR